MKRFMWSFLALLIVACVGVYLAGGFECFAASPGTAGAAIPGDRTKAYAPVSAENLSSSIL